MLHAVLIALALVACSTVVGGVGLCVRANPVLNKLMQFLMTIMIGGAFCASVPCFLHYNGSTHDIIVSSFSWINVGNLNIFWGARIDALSSIMLVVILSVSFLVHLYSMSYMKEDKKPLLFFFYISLFTFLMMILVVSQNLAQLFLGWEGVGLCSFLLIGFWGHKPQAGLAANKAFIMNRIGDFGFILGIALTFVEFGSLDLDIIYSQVASMSQHTGGLTALDGICALFLLGCIGKSAQAFLHFWLPDAMEGPTPASALIHAATMVTAGVFLMARLGLLYDKTWLVSDIAILIGAITALVTAIAASTQYDIKKVIAYSTCSQLGYMFAACGVGCYGAAIFHLFTHAFFKSLLFLGAGSIIHASSGEQDITKIGNMSKILPITKWAMIVGTASISGVFPLAGFFSKDSIIELVYAGNGSLGKFAGALLLLAAFLTAFYAWKTIFMVFTGEYRRNGHAHECAAESIPLIILAGMSAISGYFGMHSWNIWGTASSFAKWTATLHSGLFEPIVKSAHHVAFGITSASLAACILGIAAAYRFGHAGAILNISQALRQIFAERICMPRAVTNLFRFFSALCSFADRMIIDKLTSRTCVYLISTGSRLYASTNNIRIYHGAYIMMFGFLVMFAFMLLMLSNPLV